MPAPKLTDNQQKALLEWLCEGLTDTEILHKLEAEFGHVLTYRAIAYYRVKFAEELDAAEEHALQAAKRRAWGRRSHRISALCDWLDKVKGAIDSCKGPGPLVRDGMPKELRDTLTELRKELGVEIIRTEESGELVLRHLYEHLNDERLRILGQGSERDSGGAEGEDG